MLKGLCRFPRGVQFSSSAHSTTLITNIMCSLLFLIPICALAVAQFIQWKFIKRLLQDVDFIYNLLPLRKPPLHKPQSPLPKLDSAPYAALYSRIPQDTAFTLKQLEQWKIKLAKDNPSLQIYSTVNMVCYLWCKSGKLKRLKRGLYIKPSNTN